MGLAVLFFRHLRLPFQLVLAPIFLVGALSAGHRPAFFWIVPFLAVHAGLYGGATVFNSYYDRDRGPIAFMKRPVPVSRTLRDLALTLEVLAVLVLLVIDVGAGILGAALLAMGCAYSHPRPRWKASAVGGLAAVALGQGAGAVYLGYLATGGALLPPASTHLCAAGAALVVAGLFPLTQVYQIEEDRRRGDRTLPVRAGWRRTFAIALASVAAGLWVLSAGLAHYIGSRGVLTLLLAPAGLAAAVVAWARRFETGDPERNHDWAMAIGSGASLFFWALLILGFIGT
jgi:4-hydroxybenzoate polyprenyltransferase